MLEAQLLGRGSGGDHAQLELRGGEGCPLLVGELVQRRVEAGRVQLRHRLRRLPEQSAAGGARAGAEQAASAPGRCGHRGGLRRPEQRGAGGSRASEQSLS